MDLIYNTIESIFEEFVRYGILLLEIAGVVILIVTAVKSIIHLFQRDPHVRLNLAEGIALALEFKLGSEVLRTVIVRTWAELAILGAIVVLRAAITFLLFWEIKKEKEEIDVKKKTIQAAMHAAHKVGTKPVRVPTASLQKTVEHMGKHLDEKGA